MGKYTIVGLGELLWDVFPSHKELGGAPANFAYICSLLGDEGLVASRIGIDELGTDVLQRLKELGVSNEYVQEDPIHPTGTAQVEVASDGQPRFEITQNVAWDFIEWSHELKELAVHTDAVCFGSLAQRGARSHATIQHFLNATRKNTIKVFDVNLRQTFHTPEILKESVQAADIVKLNQDELPVLLHVLGGTPLEELSSARWLRQTFDLDMVCVTRGSAGSLLVRGKDHHEHFGKRVKVADAVGAGDAFTATLVHHLLRGSELNVMNDAANRVGSWVASKPGATPAPDPDVFDKARARSA